MLNPVRFAQHSVITVRQRSLDKEMRATRVAFARDPGGDAARQAKVKLVIERCNGLKDSTNGNYIIDMTCKENDELLAIYK